MRSAIRPRPPPGHTHQLALTDNHLRTGLIGTPLLLPALSRIGRDELAYKMLLHEEMDMWRVGAA